MRAVLFVFAVSLLNPAVVVAGDQLSELKEKSKGFTSASATEAFKQYIQKIEFVQTRSAELISKAQAELIQSLEAALVEVAKAKDVAELQRISQFIEAKDVVFSTAKVADKKTETKSAKEKQLEAELLRVRDELATVRKTPPIVARHFAAEKFTGLAVFLEGGVLVGNDGNLATWELQGRTLITKFPTVTDRCLLSDDGMTYQGTTQDGTTIRGNFILRGFEKRNEGNADQFGARLPK